MISLVARFKALQDKADIVSAFAIIMGMDIVVSKLRAFHLQFSDEEIARNNPTHLILQLFGWEEVEVPMASEGDLKHLGVLHDPTGQGDGQLAVSKAILTSHCNTISSRKCSAELKFTTLKLCTFNKIKYSAKFSSWDLSILRDLDREVNKFIRKSAQLLPSHPTHLLYCPVDEGGFGITRLSDCIIKETLGVLHRALHSDAASKHAAESIYERTMRYSLLRPCIGPSATATAPTNEDRNAVDRQRFLLLDSALELLHESGISLAKGVSSLTIPSTVLWISSLTSIFPYLSPSASFLHPSACSPLATSPV